MDHGWIDGWVDGWMDRLVDGQIDVVPTYQSVSASDAKSAALSQKMMV